jgi:hypothetical protein
LATLCWRKSKEDIMIGKKSLKEQVILIKRNEELGGK